MNKLIINADLGKDIISKHVQGQFAEHLGRCIYEGLWVGEDSAIPNTRGIRNDVVAALKKLRVPNIRWPGGCFADTYHWMDGIGPRAKRPSIVNVFWGGVTENNHFGTHEFLDLCEMLGSEPYICGNVGSGTVQEMAQWLEYVTMPGDSPMAGLRRKNGREQPWELALWAVGNENWGCGGQMIAEQYADEYRRYASYCRNYAGKNLYKVACGFDIDWNDKLLKTCTPHMNGLSIHYYTVPGSWQKKGLAAQFSNDQHFLTMKKAMEIDTMLRQNIGLLDRYDPAGRIGLVVDEWGTWFEVEPGTNKGFLYQQNTVRDALVAGLTLNLFNSYCRRVKVANIAQFVNVLQAMVLTDGPRMLCTPTYHVFEMYSVHQDATLLPTTLESDNYEGGDGSVPQISASASRDAKGKVHVTLCNLHPDKPAQLPIELRGREIGAVKARVLAGKALNAHNTFDKPNEVKPRAFAEFTQTRRKIEISLPPHAVAAMEIQ